MKVVRLGAAVGLALAASTCANDEPLGMGGGTGGVSGGGGTITHNTGGAPPISRTGSGASGGRASEPPPPPKSAPRWRPPHHVELPLVSVGPKGSDWYAYVPHRGGDRQLRGSGHTHCAPDHSMIPCGRQQQRLRDLPGHHGHHFVWTTAHTFVAPDPAVSGIEHLFATEVYVGEMPSGASPHVLAYLPNADLVDPKGEPFGNRLHKFADLVGLITDAGGLAALAHPARSPLSSGELAAVDERLWGIEAISGASDVPNNLAIIDARLSAGAYTCLTAGGDIHAEDDRLTRGYQVVSVSSGGRDAIFDAVRTCNFFVCGTQNTDVEPVEPISLFVDNRKIVLSTPRKIELMRFVGREGQVLSEVKNTTEARYEPTGDELYVRAEAVDQDGRSRCLSQPVWLVEIDD